MGHAGVFLLYAALAFNGLGFAYLLVPETKGLSLVAVQALWAKHARPRMPLIARFHSQAK